MRLRFDGEPVSAALDLLEEDLLAVWGPGMSDPGQGMKARVEFIDDDEALRHHGWDHHALIWHDVEIRGVHWHSETLHVTVPKVTGGRRPMQLLWGLIKEIYVY